jgi:hypothetical protein
LNFKRTSTENFEMVKMISEVKNLSDEAREHAYSWNISSQHPVKINALLRVAKLLTQRVQEIEEQIKHKK